MDIMNMSVEELLRKRIKGLIEENEELERQNKALLNIIKKANNQEDYLTLLKNLNIPSQPSVY